MNGAPPTVTGPPAEATQRPLQWLVLLLVALLIWVLRPVLGALLVGGLVVLIAARSYDRLVVKLRGRRAPAAAIATSVVTLAVLLPLSLALYFAVGEAADGLRSLAHEVSARGGYAGLVAGLPPWARDRLPSASGGMDTMLGWAGHVASATPRLLASTGWLITEALLTVVTIYYLFLDGHSLVMILRQVSPLRREQTDALLDEFQLVAIALFRGTLVVALAQGLAATLGYAIFGSSHVLLLGVVTALASFVPLVGTAIVWAPLVVALALGHHEGRALGLLAWCVTVVGLIDNVLRPFVSRGHMALPRLLVFLTLFGGLQIFGPKGLLLGPLLGSLAVTAVRLLAKQR